MPASGYAAGGFGDGAAGGVVVGLGEGEEAGEGGEVGVVHACGGGGCWLGGGRGVWVCWWDGGRGGGLFVGWRRGWWIVAG